MEIYKKSCKWCEAIFHTPDVESDFCCPTHRNQFMAKKRRMAREASIRFQLLPDVVQVEVKPEPVIAKHPTGQIHDLAKELGFKGYKHLPVGIALKITRHPKSPYMTYGKVMNAWEAENKMAEQC